MKLTIWALQVLVVYLIYTGVLTVLPKYVLDRDPWMSEVVAVPMGILFLGAVVVLLVAALVAKLVPRGSRSDRAPGRPSEPE